MSVQYKDYYQILGLSRTAGEGEIKAAYRKLAKKYHPDVNKSPESERLYKEVNEAYEVLKDPEKRKLYDELGPNWQQGRQTAGGYQRGPYTEYRTYGDLGDMGDFSDFFRTIFGGMGMGMDMGMSGGRPSSPEREFPLEISLQDALRAPIKRKILIQDQLGQRSMDVKLPRGITEGSKLSLRTERGPVKITVKIAPDRDFKVQGHDLVTSLSLSPWDAALGMESMNVPTPTGPVSIKIKECTQNGQRLRIRGKGLPLRDGGNGDLYVKVEIAMPKRLTEKEKELLSELRKVSR